MPNRSRTVRRAPDPRLRIAGTPDDGPVAGQQLLLTTLDIFPPRTGTGSAVEADIEIRDARLIVSSCPAGEHAHEGPCKVIPSVPEIVLCIRPG